ncbi:MAG TPA: histidinol dehydrogenase [Kofleriaceae bacterium]|nr:histidinol dehydrogenase [Kofleriaceae bacterium]
MPITILRPDDADYATGLDALCRRTAQASPEVERAVTTILDDVRDRGDDAVREYTERFDRRAPGAGASYEVSPARWDELSLQVAPAVRAALERAAARIRTFHESQLDHGYVHTNGGARLELRVEPLDRVGIYVPGGTALYPSSVLMTAVPARVAGVREIIMVTPGLSPETLAAARIAGVDRVFEIGGAQAIGALAYGTATVPRVDKIVGPGNQWVASAKRAVFGEVDIDSVAGPSEVLIIADAGAQPRWIAADLLAQAEHDVEARPILLCLEAGLPDRVAAALREQLATLPRAAIAGESLRRYGVAAVMASLEDALAFATRYAPEHLELQVADAREVATRVRGAGAIFVGPYTPEAAGDYTAGPNHVLPTSGAARYASPLGVYDFRKHTSVIELDRAALADQRADIEALAEVEGLHAHGRSVAIRFEDGHE